MKILAENNVIRGEDAIQAIGWAEERRRELNIKQEQLEATSPAPEEMNTMCLLNTLKEAVLLLKILVYVVCFIFVVVVVKK